MGNFGRYVCVAIPFALTLGSIVAMLIGGLAGVADKSLYMFRVDLTNLSISPASVTNLINSRSPESVGFHDPTLLEEGSPEGAKTSNITGADLGLYELYDIGLWGYCYTPQNGTQVCTKPAFNWAETQLNITKNNIDSLVTATGQNVTLPKEITSAISAFGSVTRWTEIVFIIAIVALGVELFLGIFASCSRVFSCITFLVAGIATVAVCAAASLATAMSVVVVGAVEGTAKFYGVKADFNTRFLAAVWIGAAFAIAAGLFWLFTICCCAPDHHSKSRKRSNHAESEKFIPTGSYQPIHADPSYPSGYNARHSVPQYGYATNANTPRRDLAYEPYSHANV